jgi:hypothetical protein
MQHTQRGDIVNATRAAALCLLALAVGIPRAMAQEAKPAHDEAKNTFAIPYRLTDTKHVLVRAKLNGRGPFNFIMDTGAPAVFITTAVAKKVGLEEDKKGWGTFDKFVIEGGLQVDEAKARVEDLFQLEGMNSMGLAGVELHGVIGYNVLAKYRITYDFTADKLTFVKLDFTPPEVMPIGRGGSGQGGLEMTGTIMKMLAGFMGVKPNFEVLPTGFLGIAFTDDKAMTVKAVLPQSPADEAGILTDDVIESITIGKKKISRNMLEALQKAAVGDTVQCVIKRGDTTKTISLQLGKGL